MNHSNPKVSQMRLICWLCILGAMCLLTILPMVSNSFAQGAQPSSSTPAKPAKLETKSEDEKREELGKKLERRREKLNNNSGSREETRQEKPRENKEVKKQPNNR